MKKIYPKDIENNYNQKLKKSSSNLFNMHSSNIKDHNNNKHKKENKTANMTIINHICIEYFKYVFSRIISSKFFLNFPQKIFLCLLALFICFLFCSFFSFCW